jgi:hypothetical protein
MQGFIMCVMSCLEEAGMSCELQEMQRDRMCAMSCAEEAGMSCQLEEVQRYQNVVIYDQHAPQTHTILVKALSKRDLFILVTT